MTDNHNLAATYAVLGTATIAAQGEPAGSMKIRCGQA